MVIVLVSSCDYIYRAQQKLKELESQANDPGKPAPHTPKAEAPNLEGVAEEVALGEEGLRTLQEELDKLQENFDKAVIDKHALCQTCQELAEKLKSAYHLLERYRCASLLTLTVALVIMSKEEGKSYHCIAVFNSCL